MGAFLLVLVLAGVAMWLVVKAVRAAFDKNRPDTAVAAQSDGTMKLLDVVRGLAGNDSELTIYVRHPWTPSADAHLAAEGSSEENRLKQQGYRYFIEVSIATEFLNGWRAQLKTPADDRAACERLIKYATEDA